MAKVVIAKGGKTKKVPYSTYLNSFKSAGWEIIKSTSKNNAKEVASATSEALDSNVDKDEWDEADEELAAEKSIDEMDISELRAYAASKGINTKDLKTVGALKRAIKGAM